MAFLGSLPPCFDRLEPEYRRAYSSEKEAEEGKNGVQGSLACQEIAVEGEETGEEGGIGGEPGDEDSSHFHELLENVHLDLLDEPVFSGILRH